MNVRCVQCLTVLVRNCVDVFCRLCWNSRELWGFLFCDGETLVTLSSVKGRGGECGQGKLLRSRKEAKILGEYGYLGIFWAVSTCI